MKILILRFSSFGDVMQTLSVAGALKQRFPEAEIHWATRTDVADLLQQHPAISKIWTIAPKSRLSELLQFSRTLASQPWTHVYDAHNSLRSHIISWHINGFLGLRRLWRRHIFLRRPIYRLKRILLFHFRWNLFPQPFSGQKALLNPLRSWDVEVNELPPTPQLFLPISVIKSVESRFANWFQQPYVALAPSAAYLLKRWPVEYWRELIRNEKDTRFALLGGPADQFLGELEQLAPDRVKNFAGALSLLESSVMVLKAQMLIANDTGLMHVAEQLGRPCIALMGPAPFGFPSRATTKILERKLPCRPCSKHGKKPCTNPQFHQCLRDILPGQVALEMAAMRHAATS